MFVPSIIPAVTMVWGLCVVLRPLVVMSMARAVLLKWSFAQESTQALVTAMTLPSTLVAVADRTAVRERCATRVPAVALTWAGNLSVVRRPQWSGFRSRTNTSFSS
eukprot:GILJ01003903.1.p2 GENE.GILJ01003903.1~~GILJ01003903.1.p2  ORF type:complete len:106 (+),score=0.63 GILJ01003903.1:300-617(+)